MNKSDWTNKNIFCNCTLLNIFSKKFLILFDRT